MTASTAETLSGKPRTALTNRQLFTLSILAACLLPTLVTGIFGMNTEDLPFQNSDGGTWYALAIAAAAGAAAYWGAATATRI